MTVVYPDVVAQVLDLVEREALGNIARQAASEGASKATVALFVAIAEEHLAASRKNYLLQTAALIDRQLNAAALH